MRIKILYAVIIILSVFFLKSCGSSDIYDYDFDSGDPGEILSNILASYRKNGMTSWWDILAVYNAGENPMDYKGFGDVLNSLDGGETNIKAASYVIAANAALAIGADEAHFENYGEYKSKLKDFLEENPADNNYTINDYIFAYLALFTSGENFSFRQAISYLSGLQKSDGGFSLSGNSGDIDITAYTFQVLDIAGEREPFEWTVEFTDAIFNFFGNNIRENGTFVEFWGKTENANSTAAALSAFIKLGGKNEITSEKYREMTEKTIAGLSLFKLTDSAGYSHTIGGRENALATSQAAIALGDVKNNMSVWEKLYLDIRERLYFE